MKRTIYFLAAFLAGTATAGAAMRATKPKICEEYEIFTSRNGGKIAECRDGGKASIMRTWATVKLTRPDNTEQTYLLGWP